MSLSNKTKRSLEDALVSKAAAAEISAAIDAATGGVGTNPSVATLTTTGDITSGGHLKLASGKTVKVNTVQVVGAQQTTVATLTITATTGSLPTADGAITVSDTATPTVVELLEFCVELNAKVNAYRTALRAHGLIA